MTIYAVPRAIDLIFPMPPNLANSRMHHMVKAKIKVAYWSVLDLHLLRRNTITGLAALRELPKMIER